MRELLKQTLWRLGFDMVRVRHSSRPEHAAFHLARTTSSTLVLDVGANVGQFAATLLRQGFAGRVVSFEPQSDAWNTLSTRARRVPNWTVAPRMAIGSHVATLELNLSGNSVSSSLLPMLRSHEISVPDSAYTGSESVSMMALDQAADRYVLPTDRIFLKMDTQGYEYEVLSGAKQIMPRVVGIQSELSIVPLYSGQRLILELIEYIRGLGFELFSLCPGLRDPASGRLLQADGFFIRRQLVQDS